MIAWIGTISVMRTGSMPADARQGRRWSDHQMVVSGILFRTRAGCPWRDLPPEYGNW